MHQRRLLRDQTSDTGCGLKAMRRDAFLGLPYFDHMHRYLPALILTSPCTPKAPETRPTSTRRS